VRKTILAPETPAKPPASRTWLDLDRLTRVEISSEDADHPIEGALLPGLGSGWIAAGPGEQMIRLLFDEPTTLRHIALLFREEHQARTQEFVLRWSADRGAAWHDIVRQQFNFGPPATTTEREGYDVRLEGVTALELRIVPEVGGGPARASLGKMNLA
jgi:hypothetical protein